MGSFKSRSRAKVRVRILLLGKNGKLQEFPRARFERLFSLFNARFSKEALPEFAGGPVHFIRGTLKGNSKGDLKEIYLEKIRFYLNSFGRLGKWEKIRILKREKRRLLSQLGQVSCLPKDDEDFDTWEPTRSQRRAAVQMILNSVVGKFA